MARTADEEEAVEWLRKSVEIRRKLFAQEPGHAVVQRELAVALIQLGRATNDLAFLVEARDVLAELRGRGALEASFEETLDWLLEITSPSEGAEPSPDTSP